MDASASNPIAALDSTAELGRLLETWANDNGSGADPVPTLTRLAELVEQETEAYLKMDPDPFDDRHPSRAHPDCTLGHLLKALFKNEEFMNRLVNNYMMQRENSSLNTVACRVLLDILPGLETSVVFQDTEGLVNKLFNWAEKANNPLKSYATGLLAAAMEVQEIAANFREQNSHLVPIMLKELKSLSQVSLKPLKSFVEERPFSHLNKEKKDVDSEDILPLNGLSSSKSKPGSKSSPPPVNGVPSSIQNDQSNSSWAELEPYMIGSYQVYPLTVEMQQRFILQYLTPLGEYQELLPFVLEEQALLLILHYINLKENHDVRLAFEALKYLAALLCHKKFAVEFISVGGLQRLLDIYRPSVAATGVSICLYYLAYSEDAMERVCLLPQHILSDLVAYGLWLLERSHDSSRCHVTMSFGLMFSFRVILELFDSQDGLRKLINVMSTLDIFILDSTSKPVANDDQVFASRQTARNVCVALKRYYDAHLAIKAEQLQRSHSRNQGGSPQPSTLRYKASRYTSETIQENIETLLEFMPLRMRWTPVEDFLRLGGVQLLLQLMALSYEWNHSVRTETIKNALDVLTVCSVSPKTQLALCENVPLTDNQNTVGMSIILGAAEGELVSDPDIQRSALNVIINCVCGPMVRLSGSVGRVVSGNVKRKSSVKSGEDLLSKMWNSVRANNGIMVLLNLLTVKTPITDADSIRALACKALCGLARSETVKQIISKLPLFTNSQLQVLMREPVLQDKRYEHVKFCKFCIQLMERVTGSPVTTGIESSLSKISKNEVVAQTKIVYLEKDLLQLIHQHLLNKGLTETAAKLHTEAGLPTNQPRTSTSTSAQMCLPVPSSPRVMRPITSCCGNMNASVSSPITPLQSSGSTTFSFASPKQVTKPARHTLIQKSQGPGMYQPSPVLKRLQQHTKGPQSGQQASITLESIVTEYLRKQHALCKNPVLICPPFELFVPHRCPEPLYRNSAPVNMAARVQRKQIFSPFGGPGGIKQNRKFIHSRFRPLRTFREADESGNFSCCSFSPCGQFLFLGTVGGDLKVYNFHSGALEATYSCHESELTGCQPSKDGKLLLTSSAWRRPLSSLWTFTDLFEMKHSFEEDYYVEFGKLSQERIVGTKYDTANIYDTATGQLICSFQNPELSNNYTKNRATFDPTDELVLSDGILWDVRSSTSVHKFDKFNPSISGVFHPNGLEIVSNSEIWDLRTFHLLHTVPALDQCQVIFTHSGDVIYGAMLEEETEMEAKDQQQNLFGSSFRTFDATDYSNIATIDIKKNIYDLKTDYSDCFLAIVENQGARDALTNTESICRLYEIGRQREEDDDEDAEEEESDDMEDDDDTDDDDDDDDDDDEEGIDGDHDNDQHNDNDSDEEMDLSLSDGDDDDDDSDDSALFALNF